MSESEDFIKQQQRGVFVKKSSSYRSQYQKLIRKLPDELRKDNRLLDNLENFSA